ncbi:MAG: glutamine--scyllo-inositol aminotransferase [unclassified Hahellaceae]|nr:glutamine--scyllo-inositol aminotransferase [Hahellaceae bacterium]
MLKLSKPNLPEPGIQAVVEVLRSGDLVAGNNVNAFEQALADFLEVPYAFLVSSGTAALHLSLLAIGLEVGDEVIVPGFTFPATANAVKLCGAEVIFADVDSSYCLTVDSIKECVAGRDTSKIKGIVVVHEFGHMADMAGLGDFAAEMGWWIIEDAACALGAESPAGKAGTVGSLGCYSFHPRKTLTTGEGGLVVCKDSALANKVALLRSHGIQRTKHGIDFLIAGFNYRMTDFQAALGLHQLQLLPDWIRTRRHLASVYSELLKELHGVTVPVGLPGHSWQTYMIVLDQRFDRDQVIANMLAQGFQTNLGAQALPSLSVFKTQSGERCCPVATNLYRQGLALPFCEQYSEQDLQRVCRALENCLREAH